jgi:hypothetical protein
MNALKFLVIFLAVLIVVGFTVIVVTIAHRLKHGDAGQPERPGVATLALPPQSKVLDMTGTGSSRVALRIEGPDGRQSVLLIDAQSGRLIETTELVPAKPAP